MEVSFLLSGVIGSKNKEGSPARGNDTCPEFVGRVPDPTDGRLPARGSLHGATAHGCGRCLQHRLGSLGLGLDHCHWTRKEEKKGEPCAL